MANIIAGGAILLVIALAVRGTLRHFAGGGGCCGGGGTAAESKRLDAPAVATKVLHIRGMKCAGCRAKVQNAINAIDGASAKVSRRRGTATVRMTREVADDDLRVAVAGAGDYAVTAVERRGA